MKLSEGNRFGPISDDSFIRVVSGCVEVYAAARDEGAFRQMFLMECLEGDAIFPSMDEFEEIHIFIYAVDDAEIETISHGEGEKDSQISAAELLPLMRDWFHRLSLLTQFHLLAAKGDDVINSWSDSSVLTGSYESGSELWKAFEENESLFSMLLGTRFHAEDVSLSRRVELREKWERRLDDETAENLLGEPGASYGFQQGLVSGEADDSKLSETAFIVRAAAKALFLPTENIRLDSSITKKLDASTILRRLIQNGGMAFRKITLEKGWERTDAGTMIGYCGAKRELCAIIPETPESYRIITFKNPEGQTVTGELAEEIAPDAYFCFAGFPSRRLSVKDLLQFMFRQCWRIDYRTIIIASLFSGLIPILTPIVTETIFSDIIPINDREGLATVTQVMMVTGFTTAALSLMRSIAVMRISLRVDMSAEAALWHRLLRLPTSFFKKYQAGDLLSRMQGLSAVKDFMTGEYVGGVFSAVFSFWSLILMLWYSVPLTLVAGIIWILYFIVTAFVYRRVLRFQKNLIEAGNRSAGQVQEIMSGLPKFRAHGAESEAFFLWSKAFGEEWKWSLALRWQGNYNAIISAIQPFILTMLLYYMVMYRMTEMINGVPHRTVDYATFLAFSSAYSMFNSALVSVIPLVVKIFSAKPHIDNLRPILDAEPEITEDKADAGALSGSIEVRHISFGYVPGRDVLHDVSFEIKAGESVAIVGPSGCGKSTLLRLLLGFETPGQGAIFYDGQDLSELSVSSIRSQLGVVLQNGQLMTGDIFSNIAGVTNIKEADAWAAAEAAGIADDIRMMPMGMLTMISEGSGNISGGQRQRLLLARAIASRPPILILDEATSALDNASQAIVTESLARLNATRIIVAHRLSTIKEADRILVMDAGQIVERGKFDELVQKGGLFSRLVARQSV